MWSRIALLTLGTFAIGTDGFIVAGVLQDIAAQLNVSVTLAGQLVTGFAAIYALSSPLVASVAANLPRRKLLLGAMAIFIVGNGMAALATSYAMLFTARIITAVSSAAYTPCASVVAAMLVTPNQRGRALSLVMAGITVSTIVGVPLGTWMGGFGGFRVAFWLIAALGVIAFCGLARWLPDSPNPPAIALRTRLGAAVLPGVPAALLVTALAITAGFTVYIYIGPLLTATMQASQHDLSIVLMVFGIAGTLGNAASSWLVDNWGVKHTITLSLSVVACILIVFPLMATSLCGALIGVCIWNIAAWLLLPAQQHYLLSTAPQAGQILISLNASAMYLGIGAAGGLGGVILQTWDARALGPVAALAAAGALISHLLSNNRGMPQPSSEHSSLK
ncbi:MFS transporter [Brenneria sp. 4F2]|nr:MFS transporter [Brenneria bubanii]